MYFSFLLLMISFSWKDIRISVISFPFLIFDFAMMYHFFHGKCITSPPTCSIVQENFCVEPSTYVAEAVSFSSLDNIISLSWILTLPRCTIFFLGCSSLRLRYILFHGASPSLWTFALSHRHMLPRLHRIHFFLTMLLQVNFSVSTYHALWCMHQPCNALFCDARFCQLQCVTTPCDNLFCINTPYRGGINSPTRFWKNSMCMSDTTFMKPQLKNNIEVTFTSGQMDQLNLPVSSNSKGQHGEFIQNVGIIQCIEKIEKVFSLCLNSYCKPW